MLFVWLPGKKEIKAHENRIHNLGAPSQLNWLPGHNGGKGEWMSISAYNKWSPGLDIFHPSPNLLLSAAPWNTCYYPKFPFYRWKHQGSEQLTHLQPAIQTRAPQAVVGDPEIPNFNKSLGNSHILKANQHSDQSVKQAWGDSLSADKFWAREDEKAAVCSHRLSKGQLPVLTSLLPPAEKAGPHPTGSWERSQVSANHSFSNYLIYIWCLT